MADLVNFWWYVKTSYLGPIYRVKWVLGPLGAFGDIKKKIPISSDFFPVILGPVVLVLSQFFQFSKFLDFQHSWIFKLFNLCSRL